MRAALLGLSVWVLVVSCGPGGSTGGNSFIAMDRDFSGYTTWEHFTVDGGAVDTVHTAGARTVYVSERPVAGAESFPQGTIIVKELEFQTLAMVKRGGSYNASGAPGWEWFELRSDPGGAVSIVWRGLGPPAGEHYGQAGQTCNGCHGANRANDSVLSAQLKLNP